MTRLRVWCAGASIGYLVGWLAGSNVQRLAEGRRLAADYRRNEGAAMSAERRARSMAHTPARTAARPREPRTGLSAPVESPEPLNGRETGAQRCSDVDIWSYQHCARKAGHPGSHIDDTGLTAWGTHEPPILPAIREAMDEAAPPCTTRSPGGGLTCCRKGAHTAHLFEGAHARDRKQDADEGIE
jgi:hypothetical protein